MGVYIKGMEMPKCCAECDAEGHYENSYGDEYGFFCPFGYKAYTSETRELKRLDDCPLVPIPMPHGRLIDADALLNDKGIGTQIAGWGKMYHETCIEYAPTIIEAEEGIK